MEESKFYKKSSIKKVLSKNLSKILSKVLICIIIFLISVIVLKANPSLKDKTYKYLFGHNLSFAKINATFKKYFGNIIPLDNISPPEDVLIFDEKLSYKEVSAYMDGVKLTTSTQYLVPTLESGIVVYIGEKDKYGKTIIIQQINGIDVWYANINFSNFSLYDYIEKGTLLGEAKDNSIYLVFQKNGAFLNYKDYI